MHLDSVLCKKNAKICDTKTKMTHHILRLSIKPKANRENILYFVSPDQLSKDTRLPVYRGSHVQVQKGHSKLINTKDRVGALNVKQNQPHWGPNSDQSIIIHSLMK